MWITMKNGYFTHKDMAFTMQKYGICGIHNGFRPWGSQDQVLPTVFDPGARATQREHRSQTD